MLWAEYKSSKWNYSTIPPTHPAYHKLLLFVECRKDCKTLPWFLSSSCFNTYQAPPCQGVSLFPPPHRSVSMRMCVNNLLWTAGDNESHSLQQVNKSRDLFPSEHRDCFCPEKVKLFDSDSQEVKWRCTEISWTKKNSAVRSVWIYWRIRWLFPVDTATAWTVLKPTGMERMRRKSTAALSVGRPSHRGLSWWKTPC